MKSFHEYVEMRDDNVDESFFGGMVGAAGAAAQGIGSGLWGAGKAALKGAGSVGRAALNLGDKAISATAQPIIQGAKDFAKGTADAYSKIDINRLNDIIDKSTDQHSRCLWVQLLKITISIIKQLKIIWINNNKPHKLNLLVQVSQAKIRQFKRVQMITSLMQQKADHLLLLVLLLHLTFHSLEECQQE